MNHISNRKRGPEAAEQLLTPAEVAAIFRVDPKTVTRWAKGGRLSSIRTLGGHRRYLESEVRGLLSDAIPETSPQASPPAEQRRPVAARTAGVETATAEHRRRDPQVQIGDPVIALRAGGALTGVVQTEEGMTADKAAQAARYVAQAQHATYVAPRGV